MTTVATVLTTFGFGPLAEEQGSYALPQYVLGIVLQTYLIACALVAIPLSLAVGQQLAAIGRSERESDLLRRVIDSAHVAIIGADAVGRITLFNPGAERILGYRPDEVLGRSDPDVPLRPCRLREGRRARRPRRLRRTSRKRLAEPGLAGAHMRFLRKDGTERTHAMTLSPVRRRPRRGDRLRLHLGRRRRASSRPSRRCSTPWTPSAARSSGCRRSTRSRTPSSRRSATSCGRRSPASSATSRCCSRGSSASSRSSRTLAVRRIDTNSKRLLSLIDELLTLSRVHERRAGADAVARPARRRLHGVRRGGAVVGAARAPAPDSACRTAEVPVTGNRELLERVVVNLLGNAAKFTPDGGTVTLTVAREGQEAVVDGARHRHRHPGRRAAAPVHPVLPVEPRPAARHPGQRPRPVDRPRRSWRSTAA